MKAIKTFLLIISFIMICGSIQAATFTLDVDGIGLLTIVESDPFKDGDTPGNTVGVDASGSAWASTSTSNTDGLWRERAFPTGYAALHASATDRVYEVASTDKGTAPEVVTTVSGLPSASYEVYLLHVYRNDGSSDASRTLADLASPPTILCGESNQAASLSEVGVWGTALTYLGIAEGDTISVYIDGTTNGNRNDFHGIAYKVVERATNPSPVDGTLRLFPETDPALGWNAGQDPANPANANPAIAEHIVYMGIFSEPNDTPILTEAARVAAAGGTAEWNPTGQWEIERDQFVYWSIGEALVQGTTDPNDIVAGPVWFFSTASAYAEIDPDTPADSRVDLGETASFSISATNPFTEPADSTGLSYQWYKAGTPDMALSNGAKYAGVASNSLTVSDIVSDDEGNYFCLVTVDSNANAKASNAGYLIVKRLVGHWKLDGNANDELGNNGIEIGTVAYEAGMVDDCVFLDNIDQDNEDNAPFPINHIEIPHTDAYREDVFTVSCWVKSISPGFEDEHTYGGAVSKTDSTGDGPGWSMRKEGLGYNARWFTYGSSSIVSAKNIYFSHGSDWHHLVGVYDEENNMKSLYTDGVLETTIDDLGTNTGILVADGNLLIGVDYALRSPGEILIDDVQLYNYALDKFEIGQIYADGAGVPVCVEHPAMDLDVDCDVDLDDLKLFVADWLECGIVPDCNI